MKKFEITEERIKTLADNNSWSESKLKEWYPNAFALEVGKWYYYGNCLLVWNGGKRTYGFNCGNWSIDYMFSTDDIDGVPNPQEVETALINESKKRGFVEGVTYKSPNGAYTRVCKFPLYLNDVMDCLCCPNGEMIFYNGTWATIIKQKEYTMQEIANALKVDVNDLKIKK
jgi:hypothetical protein